MNGGAIVINKDIEALEQQNIALVTDFCKAWESADVSRLLEFIDDRIFYQMWDADDAIKVDGKDAFRQVVGGFLASMNTVEFEISRTQCMGKIVINQRTDRFMGDGGDMLFTVTGMFVVEDGKIVYWKDYLFPGAAQDE
jgi:limonene-1,2-epoxide hydrolase